jgi:hypothetical protein
MDFYQGPERRDDSARMNVGGQKSHGVRRAGAKPRALGNEIEGPIHVQVWVIYKKNPYTTGKYKRWTIHV